MKYPQTEDGRYFLVPDKNGRPKKWRCSDPRLSPEERQAFVDGLMLGMRIKSRGTRLKDTAIIEEGRVVVNDAKVALGERGPKWWEAMTAEEESVVLSARMRTLCRLLKEPLK